MPVEGRAPLRTIDDFIGAEARFQMPNVADLDRWSNRVLNNLLYYQTNYFVAFALVFVLVGMINPTQVMARLSEDGTHLLSMYFPSSVPSKNSADVISILSLAPCRNGRDDFYVNAA